MINKVSLEKFPTGIPGLDTLLDGGISKYSFIVLTGAPGSGKTTLAHQIMFAAATPQRKALFFTVMGEPALKMLRFQQQYAFFDPAKVGSSIKYVNLAEDLQTCGFDGVLDRILTEVQNFSPDLIFVDSFKSIVQATMEETDSTANLQYFVQRLGVHLASWQATTFLIGEYTEDVKADNPVFTVADGVIHLSQEMDENAMVRKLRIVKMRGTYHMTGLHSFRMTDKGIQVYPRLLAGGRFLAKRSRLVRSERVRLSTGNAVLDDMLGGGIPSGYSVVIAGPPGCGKTVLATSFLTAGANEGQHGIIASFEHFLSSSSNPALDTLLDAGQVTELRPVALDLSLEELVSELEEVVERTGAQRVVIDSLSALELTLAPQFRINFQESLFRMLSVLHVRGVTILLIQNLIDVTVQPLSPSSFIVDGVISMKYVEQDNQLIKLISCPKLRGSSHSSDVRSYVVHENGITIAKPV